MPTVAYDFDEAADFADFVVLEPGNAIFKFTNADASQPSKSGGKKVVVDLVVVATEKHNRWAIDGLVRQHLPTTGKGAGRFRDLLEALGVDLKKGKGSLKLEKYYETEVGAHVIKVAGRDTDAEGNPVYFNDLRQIKPGDQMRELLGLDSNGADEDEDEDEEEEEAEDTEDTEEEETDDEEEETEDEEDADEDAEDAEEEEEEDEEEGISWDDVMAMNLTDLKAFAKENEVSTRPPKDKKLTVAILRKRLEPLFEEGEGEGEEDPF